jgi:hypothetical protein
MVSMNGWALVEKDNNGIAQNYTTKGGLFFYFFPSRKEARLAKYKYQKIVPAQLSWGEEKKGK